jgi:hypothetical protein
VQKLIAVGSHQRLTKVLGSPTLLKAMAEEMHLRGIVDTLIPWHGPKGSLTHGEVVEALVLNRLHSPRPLYRFERWAEIRGIGDLYGHPGEDFHDDRLRQTLDAIAAYDADIQAEVALRTLTHFGVPKDMVLYDLTSLYFEGEYEESEIVTCGYSRDQKVDKKQVELALTVSRAGGVPLLHETLSGNTADVATVLKHHARLKEVLRTQDLLVISDGGMLSPENVIRLEEAEVRFLGPWGAETAILDELFSASASPRWEEMPYHGAKGDETYWATEMGVPVVWEEELADEPPPVRRPGQRGRVSQRAKRVHCRFERAIVVRSTSKQRRDEKSQAKHMTKIEDAMDAVVAGLGRRT